MKKRARETEETPQQIISQSVALLSEQAAVAMPPIHHIRRDIRRQRKELVILYLYLRTKILTSLQNTIRQLVVNNSFSSTVAMEKIGSSSSLLTRTSSSSLSPSWFMDGTFKTAPELFFQLYTIHSCTANRVLPCVYALLPNKQQATYTIFFEILKQFQHT